MEFNFFYIDTYQIDDDQSCDVATYALRKFLHGKHMKGDLNYGCWCVSSIAYVLSEEEEEVSNGQGKRKRGDDTKYHEVIPFLRNGFFQDKAIIGDNPSNSKILVGAVAHFEKHLLSETEAQSKANLLQNGPSQKKMKGSDVAILNLVRDLVDENDRKKQQALMQGMSSAMIGMGTVSPPKDFTSEEQLTNLRCEITKQQNDGGSVAQSLALHMACEKNAVKIVRLLLQIDATSVSVKDHLGRTPLINLVVVYPSMV